MWKKKTVKSVAELQNLTREINDRNGWSKRADELVESRDAAGYRDHIITKLALVTTEVAEAIEEIRKGSGYTEVYYSKSSSEGIAVVGYADAAPAGKPEGVPTELADIVIRVMDISSELGVDLQSAIEEKLEYNAKRGYMHGGKLA